jgi:hypothetical protein
MEEKTTPNWVNEEEFRDFARYYNKNPFSITGLNSFSSFIIEDKSSKAMKMDKEMAKGTGVDNTKDKDAARKRVERGDSPSVKSESPDEDPNNPAPPPEAQYSPEEIAQMEFEQNFFIDGVPRSLDPAGREEVRMSLQPRDIDAIIQPNIIGEIPKEIDENVHYGHALTMISIQVAGFGDDDIQSRVDNTPKLTQVPSEIFEKTKNIVSRLIKKEGWTPTRLAGMTSWSEMGLGDFREAKTENILYLDEQDSLNEFSHIPGVLGISINTENVMRSSNDKSISTSNSIVSAISMYMREQNKELMSIYKKIIPILNGKSSYQKSKDKIITTMFKSFNNDEFKLNVLYELLSGKFSYTENHRFGPLASSDVIITPHSTHFITMEYCKSLLKDKAFEMKVKLKKKKNKETNNSNLRYSLDGKLSSNPNLHQLSLIINELGLLEQTDSEAQKVFTLIEQNLPVVIALIAENEFIFNYSINLNKSKKEDPNVIYNFMTIQGKEFKIPVSLFTNYDNPPVDTAKAEFPKADEVQVSHMKEARDYKKEYREYQGKPEQIKNRSKRVTARRKLEREGRVKKDDGKDVHHKDGNPQNNSSENLQVMSASTNRALKDSYEPVMDEEHGAGEIGTKELLRKYLKDTPFSEIIGRLDDEHTRGN